MTNFKVRAIALAAMALAGTTSVLPASALTLEEARKNGITVALYHEPPSVYLGDDGTMKGSKSMMVLEVLRRIGVTTVKPVLLEWSALIPSLLAERADMVPAMYILPKRCEQVAFSEPAWHGEESFLVLAGNPKKLHSYEDAAKNGATLAVLSGSAELDYAKRAGAKDEQLLLLADPPSMLQAVLVGRADALALPTASIDDLVAKAGSKVERSKPFTMEKSWIPYEGAVFRKGDADLRDAYNAALKGFIGTPEFMELLKPEGYTVDNLPGTMTAAEKCSS